MAPDRPASDRHTVSTAFHGMVGKELPGSHDGFGCSAGGDWRRRLRIRSSPQPLSPTSGILQQDRETSEAWEHLRSRSVIRDNQVLLSAGDPSDYYKGESLDASIMSSYFVKTYLLM